LLKGVQGNIRNQFSESDEHTVTCVDKMQRGSLRHCRWFIYRMF